MSSPEFIEARTIVQAAVADSSNPQFIDQCLNQAQREVARARRWPELSSRAFFNTVAAYSTGTIAVVVDDATVTLTGGTFPTAAASAGYRFALSVSSPWYLVRTRTSGTAVELAQNYIDDTETASEFIVYKSNYSLPSTVDRVDEMWIHTTTAWPLVNASTDQQVTEFQHYPSGPGIPTHFMPIERDASGNRQVILGPFTPDDVYRVEYTYRRKVVDNQFTGNLDDSRWPVVVARAKALAYEPEFYDRHVAAQAEYLRLLAEEWGNDGESETQSVRVGQTRVDYPGRYDIGDIVWNNGRVVGPI